MTFIPGLLPERYETRKFLSAAIEPMATYIVPEMIDHRAELLPMGNQGSTSKCAAYGTTTIAEWWNWKRKGTTVQLDPNPLYDRAKQLDGEPNEPGTTVSAVLQAAQDLGYISKLSNGSLRYVNADMVKRAMHLYGCLLAAFDITDKWSYAQLDGWIPEGGRTVGGHAVVLCGYNLRDTIPYYTIANSWGQEHGWRGFNRMSEGMFRDQFRGAYGFETDELPVI